MVERACKDHLDGVVAKARTEHAVVGAGSASALNMAQDGRAAFQVRSFRDLLTENLADSAESNRIRGFMNDLVHDHGAAFGLCPLGDGY